jgi:hypothetical protein
MKADVSTRQRKRAVQGRGGVQAAEMESVVVEYENVWPGPLFQARETLVCVVSCCVVLRLMCGYVMLMS